MIIYSSINSFYDLSIVIIYYQYYINQMGNTHPQLRDIKNNDQLIQRIQTFNKMNQHHMIKMFGWEVRFYKNFSKGFLQSYGNIQLIGIIKFHHQKDYEQQFIMVVKDFLELRDMIISLTSNQTPGSKIGEDELCCICLDKRVEMLMPCSHTFCSQCTQLYILQKQQKTCPKCRLTFNKKMLKRITEILAEQVQIVDAIKINIKEIIIKSNPSLNRLL